ncbi:MAG: hypothetical protein ABI091_29225 [Ferruginibacter sp.]
MFKKITATILLLAFAAQTFSAPFIRLSYYLNTEAYAKDCVNKAKKAMHCNGKCQVMKHIQEEGKKQTQDAENKVNNKTEVLSSKSFFYTIGFSDIAFTQKVKNIERKSSLKDISYSFFHPPQLG